MNKISGTHFGIIIARYDYTRYSQIHDTLTYAEYQNRSSRIDRTREVPSSFSNWHDN